MKLSIETIYILEVIINLARYSILAGLGYFIFWFLKKDKFQNLRIQKSFPNAGAIATELKWSFSSAIIFAAAGTLIYYLGETGHSKIYMTISDYGWPYFLLSIGILMVVHDTYFYWAHRLMHHPKLFRHVHLVHHLSKNPTPWAAYSFHPIEAVVEVAFLPLIILFVPFHFGAIAVFLVIDMAINVLGHLGYELYPSGWTRHPIRGMINSSTHHNMHHQYFNTNYGLYFNFWDRVCGTNHSMYHETFESIAGGSNAQNNSSAVESLTLYLREIQKTGLDRDQIQFWQNQEQDFVRHQ